VTEGGRGFETRGGRSLRIAGKDHPLEELPALCAEKLAAAGLPEWEAALYRFILDWIDEEDTIAQRSSGTTGTPKDLLLSKSSMAASARNTCEFFSLRPGDTALLCLPVDYIAGKMMVARAFIGGLDLVAVDPSGSPAIPEGRTDFCAMVPLQVANTLSAGNALDRVRTLIIGGAEISPELEAAMKKRRGAVWATYGMAETCSMVALRRIDGPKAELAFTAMRGVSLSLDDRGCLAIDADYLANRVQTNDVVEMQGRASFRWLGRHDNLINSGGVKIAPEEIEALVARAVGKPCAIVGLPDTLLGTRAVAVFEEGPGVPDRESIAALLEGSVPKQAVPREVLVVERFPRNASFKVDRLKLAGELLTRRGSFEFGNRPS